MSDKKPHESDSPSRREDRDPSRAEQPEGQEAPQPPAPDQAPRARSAASPEPVTGVMPATVAPVQGAVIFNQEDVDDGRPTSGDRHRADADHAGSNRADADHTGANHTDADHAGVHSALPAEGQDPDSESTAPSAVTPFDRVLAPGEVDEEAEYALEQESGFPLHENFEEDDEYDFEDAHYEGARIEHDEDGTPLLISSSSHGRGYQTVSAVEGGVTQAVLEKRRSRRRRRNLTLSVAFGLFAALLVGFVVVLQSLFGGSGPEDFETQAGDVVEFSVEEGDGPALVRNRLLEAGIIASGDAFDEALADLEEAPELQPGEFQMREQMPAADALEVIFEEGELVHYIDITAGMRLESALARIAEQTQIPESEIQEAASDPSAFGLPDEAENLEGYIPAGEFRPSQDSTAFEILEEMVGVTFDRLEELGITEEEEQWRTVIIASLLIDEGLPGYYERIAGIIENRLDPSNEETGGLLQIDATVIYGLGTQSVQFTNEQRLDPDNDYNTYVHPGLPPGPISAPNVETMEAAANPTETDEYYWVTVDLFTGDTEFAETLEQHEEYVEEFNAFCAENPEVCEGEPDPENQLQ